MEIFSFFDFGLLHGVNGPQSWAKTEKKVKFWKRAVSLKIRICQNLLKHPVPLLENYLWCKFQQDRIIFGGVRAQKPPKMAQFMDAPSPRNFFKIFNLRTTNAMKMKLGTIVYLHKTFSLTEDLGVAQRGSGGVVGKPLKKCPKIGFLAPFFEFS